MEFDDIELYDEKLAEEGQWCPIKRGERTIIEVKLRYVDANTQAGEKLYKDARAPFAKNFKTGLWGETEGYVVSMAHVNMRDWKGVTAKGKPVPFTPAAARQFFMKDSNRWMVAQPLAFMIDPDNFVKDEEYNVEEVTGN